MLDKYIVRTQRNSRKHETMLNVLEMTAMHALKVSIIFAFGDLAFRDLAFGDLAFGDLPFWEPPHLGPRLWLYVLSSFIEQRAKSSTGKSVYRCQQCGKEKRTDKFPKDDKQVCNGCRGGPKSVIGSGSKPTSVLSKKRAA